MAIACPLAITGGGGGCDHGVRWRARYTIERFLGKNVYSRRRRAISIGRIVPVRFIFHSSLFSAVPAYLPACLPACLPAYNTYNTRVYYYYTVYYYNSTGAVFIYFIIFYFPVLRNAVL